MNGLWSALVLTGPWMALGLLMAVGTAWRIRREHPSPLHPMEVVVLSLAGVAAGLVVEAFVRG